MKKLVLFTNYYPYFKGEEYLETEIAFLSEEFDEIILFPTLLSKDMNQTRKVPDNVNIYPIYYSNSYMDKLKSMIKAIFSRDKEMKKRVKLDAGHHPIRRMYDYYFESRTLEGYDKIEKILNSINFEDDDQIVLYSYWMHATAKLAVDVKNKFFLGNVKYSLTRAHRYDVDISASPIKFLPEREYILQNLDEVFCVSQSSQRYLQETYPKYKDKVFTSHLGTKELSSKSIATKQPFHIVSCSLLRKVKNVDKIIAALELIEHENVLDIHWTHFGNGPEFENIKSMAEEKLTKVIFDLPGYVTNQEVMTWYDVHRPTAFINVSSSEGIPVSIMEAMSFGIPVIATDVGGTNEIVCGGHNGTLLNENVTVTQIAEAITKMYHLELSVYKDYAENAYKTWQESYSSSKNYSLFSKHISKQM